MIYKLWNIKRIATIIFFGILTLATAILCLLMIISIITNISLEQIVFGFLSVAFLAFTTYSFGIITRNSIIPKYHKSMEEVRDFFTLNELKSHLKSQVFIECDFKKLDFENKHNLVFDMFESEDWLYIKGTYIPKKFIYKIEKYSTAKYRNPSILIITFSNKKYTIRTNSNKNQLLLFNFLNEHQMKYAPALNDEVTKERYAEIVNKQSFMKFISIS